MDIVSIRNKNTGIEVCSQYLNTPVDLDKSRIIQGESLIIRFQKGSFFAHETVCKIDDNEGIGTLTIETTRKIWVLK